MNEQLYECSSCGHQVETAELASIRCPKCKYKGLELVNNKPNPGSKEAQDEGCTCPVLDNNHGKGVNGSFWMNGDCPLHGFKEQP